VATAVSLQSVDGFYGPQERMGLHFFNEKSAATAVGNLDLQLCPAKHVLQVGVDVKGYTSVAPDLVEADLEAGKTHELSADVSEPEKVKVGGSKVTMRRAKVTLQPR